MRMSYDKSVKLALSLGFEEVPDENAFNGKYFVKDNKIWIHDIVALQNKLDVKTDLELENLHYDVESYYKFNNHTNSMADKVILALYFKEQVQYDSSSIFYKRFELLDDATLERIVSLKEEGFDDEIIFDFLR